jgi:hypothetical protein
MVSAEAWKEWKQLPTTKEWFQLLSKAVEDIKENWASEQFVGETEYKTLYTNAVSLGQISILKRLLEVDFAEEALSE